MSATYSPFTPVNPDNACSIRITAAAGTYLAGASYSGTVTFFPADRALHNELLLHSRGVAASGFPPLCNIPHCCLPQESGPCLSPNVAVHSLKPATDRCLGSFYPFKLANQTRVHLIPDFSFSHKYMRLRALMRFTTSFPDAIPCMRQVATRYSPVRH